MKYILLLLLALSPVSYAQDTISCSGNCNVYTDEDGNYVVEQNGTSTKIVSSANKQVEAVVEPKVSVKDASTAVDTNQEQLHKDLAKADDLDMRSAKILRENAERKYNDAIVMERAKAYNELIATQAKLFNMTVNEYTKTLPGISTTLTYFLNSNSKLLGLLCIPFLILPFFVYVMHKIGGDFKDNYREVNFGIIKYQKNYPTVTYSGEVTFFTCAIFTIITILFIIGILI